MSNRSKIHERVLTATSKEELADAYAEWAKNYDRDLIDEMDYVAPFLACRMLEGYLENRQALVLDAGCGTGLVGSCLHQQGFEQIDGVDYSEEMLDQAATKEIYRNLTRVDLTTLLPIPSESYHAIISVGTFTCGHVGPEAFAELIRITKPGCFLCITVREEAWEKDGYRQSIEELEQQGAWQLLEATSADYIRQEGSHCRICIFQKCR